MLLERVDLDCRTLLHHEETLAQVFDCCLLVLIRILLVLVMLVGERVELVRPADVDWIDTLGYITSILVIALLPKLTDQLLKIMVLHHGCVVGWSLGLASHHACHVSGCNLGLSIVRNFIVPVVLLLRCPYLLLRVVRSSHREEVWGRGSNLLVASKSGIVSRDD